MDRRLNAPFGQTVLVARTALVRSVRRVAASRRRAMVGALLAVAYLSSSLLPLPAVYRTAGTLTERTAVGIATAATAALAATVTVAFAVRTVEWIASRPPESVALATGPAPLLAGRLVADLCRLAFLALPGVAVLATTAFALDAPLLLGTAIVAASALAVTAALVGVAVGVAVLVWRHTGAWGPLAAVGGVALLGVVPARTTLPAYARFGLAGSRFGAATPGTATAAGGVVLAGLLAGTAATRWVRELWRADPRPRAGGASVPVDGRRAVGVARVLWLRGLRSPGRLGLRLLTLGFVLGGTVAYAAGLAGRTGVGLLLPVAAGFGGAWLTGGLFCLNPLGDEGPALSSVLLSGGSPRVVRARFLAGLPAVPVAVCGPVAVAAAIGRPVDPVAALFAGAVAVGAPGIALGVGAFAPGFDGVEVPGAGRIARPTRMAVGGYTAALGIAFGVGLGVPAAVGAARASLAGAAAVALWTAAVAGYVYAVRRIRTHEL